MSLVYILHTSWDDVSSEGYLPMGERDLALESGSFVDVQSLVSAGGQLFWTTTPEGLVEDAPFYRAFTGQSIEEVHGVGWLDAVHPDDRPTAMRQWEQSVTTHTPFIAEYRLRRADGVYRHFMARGLPTFHPDGSLREWMGFCTDITERILAERELKAYARQVALVADVGRALTNNTSLQQRLQLCTEAVVQHLEAAFARIWTVNESESILELQASAGLYTHLDGGHSRVPIGSFKIGLIALERKPHLTNKVIGDERVNDQEWAKREGMIAFAGYPLIAGEQMVGVLALFARHPLAESTLTAISAIADEVALAIEQAHSQEFRDHMLSIVSHELKTPLTSAKALVQILQRRKSRGQDIEERHLEQVGQSINRMERLVNDLLDATRVESDHLTIEVTTCDIGALCEQAAVEKRQATGRTITLKLPKHPLWVEADMNRVMQVLDNILANALKYSPAESSVHITLHQQREQGRRVVCIIIRDQGPGIPAEALPRLFDRFYRVPGAQVLSGSGVGLGLGLYLCRRLIEQQQGRIGVESTVGHGSAFWFTLPMISS